MDDPVLSAFTSSYEGIIATDQSELSISKSHVI